MSPIDRVLGQPLLSMPVWLIAVALFGCESSSAGDSSTGGTGATAAVGGAGGGGAALGGIGGAGAGGPYGNGDPPSGGAAAQSDWAAEACDLLATQDCPFVEPLGKTGVFCAKALVEVVPGDDQCGARGRQEERCVLASGAVIPDVCPGVCPADPPAWSYEYRVLDNGDIELIHKQPPMQNMCNYVTSPWGFAYCKMEPTDPEVCHCRCAID